MIGIRLGSAVMALTMLASLAGAVAAGEAHGDGCTGVPDAETLGNVFKKLGYSPYVGRNFPIRVY
ncbi:MAG: hypothetical protein L6R28_21140 [Planctomycetes bacterium]|nr:hypothetical protein [Planctomycetota bacterium]